MDITDAINLKDALYAALAGLSAAGASIATAFGGWEPTYTLLLYMMLFDLLSGWAVAAFFKRSPKSESGKLSSNACFRGLVKKCAIIGLVLLGAIFDQALGTTYTRTTLCLFFSGSEGLSVLENLGLMGVQYPRFLREMLEALREKGDGGAEKNGGSGDG